MFDKVNFETSIIIPPEENVYVIVRVDFDSSGYHLEFLPSTLLIQLEQLVYCVCVFDKQ